MPQKRIRVALVEDDAAIRGTVQALMSQGDDFEIVGTFENGEVALRHIPALRPEVILLDLRMPRMGGIECLKSLRTMQEPPLVIIFTMFDDDDLVFRALEAGASGYLLKRAAAEEIREAILDAVAGGSPMSSSIARKVVHSFHKATPAPAESCLSEREKEVLRLISQGRGYKEVAAQMNIRLDTVRSHIRNVYRKLQVHSAAAAVTRAFGLR